MRYASMTMSWLAERKATTTAASAVHQGSTAGSVKPMARMASASATWMMIAQPRRRPRKGGRIWSSSGAQRNLKL